MKALYYFERVMLFVVMVGDRASQQIKSRSDVWMLVATYIYTVGIDVNVVTIVRVLVGDAWTGANVVLYVVYFLG